MNVNDNRTAFLDMLPSWCPAPARSVEPSGAVVFEWDMGKNWLVLAPKESGAIEYSAVLGKVEMCGQSPSFGVHEIALLEAVLR